MPKKNGHTFEFNLTYNDWKILEKRPSVCIKIKGKVLQAHKLFLKKCTCREYSKNPWNFGIPWNS